MIRLDQNRAPLYEVLEKHRKDRIVHFDVPGHKGGRGNKELSLFLGEKCLKADVNSMKPLDNLNYPVSVIKEAQQLAAEAFGAHSCFFIVNGTTSAVQAMVMSACKAGEKILMPRNVHISALNALILSGAIPVYIDPGINNRLGIALGMSMADIKKAIEEHSDAKAILVNNPTYYGICSNLKEIVELAHSHNMLVLVDEAHGTHFYFGDNMPVSAMKAGADMAAVSMHKTGGSLTQSSLLLCGKNVNHDYVRQIIGLTQTTSASYLLLVSLDLARKNLSLNGKEIFNKISELAEYARKEINNLGGYYAFSHELVNNVNIYNFDTTKLSINTREIGLAGIEVYDILRDDYDIQVEFGDLGNILAVVSAGDRAMEIERLISALYEIKRLYAKEPANMFDHNYIQPEVVYTPRKAFYANKKMMSLKDSKGKVSGEFVMAYPPGIPVLAPGEKITAEIIDYISYAKEKGSVMMGPQDMDLKNILVLEG
ncbi:MAG TPA: aminotransferase class I/II-fold pyridoxal phosphate-dependent enzyme [Defluviitaleaceae bacterium]|nr:aminotransferase class I/II-fold pyridoxal phosphate-dependent enzyme [Defluviitaleaceae bacterium]